MSIERRPDSEFVNWSSFEKQRQLALFEYSHLDIGPDNSQYWENIQWYTKRIFSGVLIMTSILYFTDSNYRAGINTQGETIIHAIDSILPDINIQLSQSTQAKQIERISPPPGAVPPNMLE